MGVAKLVQALRQDLEKQEPINFCTLVIVWHLWGIVRGTGSVPFLFTVEGGGLSFEEGSGYCVGMFGNAQR